MFCLPSRAQRIYDDGPINGNEYAWQINNGCTVSDSFTVSGGNSTITGVSFGVWLFYGDVLQSGDILISDQPAGAPSTSIKRSTLQNRTAV